MNIVEFRNVNLSFPSYKPRSRLVTSQLISIATGGKILADETGHVDVLALQNIDFELKEGDRLAVLGHNGAGKSTLLRALRGIYAPSSGAITVRGRIGSLIDISLGINPEVTGRENIMLRGALLGLSPSQIKDVIEDIVDFSGLGNFIDLPLRTYSTGMQMRLAFSISTVIRPDVLLMDEWLSVGDSEFNHKAEERLKSVIGSSKVLVLASHSRELVESTCNKCLWLDHGTVKAFGGVKAVSQQYFGNYG